MTEMVRTVTAQDLFETARSITGYLWGQFQPLTSEMIDAVNTSPASIRDGTVLLSGSRRSTVFQNQGIAGSIVMEAYESLEARGVAVEEHVIVFGINSPYKSYYFKANLDTEELHIETEHIDAVFDPGQNPAMAQRILSSLGAAVTELRQRTAILN